MLPDLLLGNLKQDVEPEPEALPVPQPDPEPAQVALPSAETDIKS
jgi:hypothetical protein